MVAPRTMPDLIEQCSNDQRPGRARTGDHAQVAVALVDAQLAVRVVGRRAGRWPRPGPRSPRRSGAGRRRARLASSCSRVRAPRIVEVTPGRSVTQASATSAIETPRSSATVCTASMTSQVRSVPRAVLGLHARGPGPRRAGWRRSAARRAGTSRTASRRRAGSTAAARARRRARPARSPTRSRARSGCTAAAGSPAPATSERPGQVHGLGQLPAGEVRQAVVARSCRPGRSRRGSAASPPAASAGRTRAPGRGRPGPRRAGPATRPAPGSGAGRTGRRRSGRRPVGKRPLVASTTRSVTSAGRSANQRPMISSERRRE